MLDLYQNIKKRRIELGLSQEELAEKLGYKSRSSVNKIEMGENDIPQSKIKAFADALQTTPAYLMGWDDDAQLHEQVKDNAPSLLNENASSKDIELLNRIINLTPENQSKLSELIDLYLNSQGSK